MDFLHTLLVYIDPREVLHVLSKIHSAPSFMDLVPKLVQSSDAMAQELVKEGEEPSLFL